MTSQQPWTPLTPRLPTLEMPAKYESNSFMTSDLNAVTNGSLSPDIHLTAPLFRNETSSSSVLKVGNYLLTARLADMSNGIAVYQAVCINTGESFLCRAVPLDRWRSVMAPYAVVSRHPNIDDVKEIITGSTVVYAMHSAPLRNAEDLHAYVRRRRRLAEPEAARLFMQVLEAVKHCHQQGVVIRDIKLRRFQFADEDSRTWIKLDGLYDAAMFDGSNDLLNDKHGCLAYISPEIVDATFSTSTSCPTRSPESGVGSSCYSGRAADMWSLGVMLYTMLVGRYPFADTDACALFTRIRRGRYSMPLDVALSPLARCLIRSLLTVKPEDRLTADEAIRHPWFGCVESINQHEQLHSSAMSLNQDDGVVPVCHMEYAEEFIVD